LAGGSCGVFGRSNVEALRESVRNPAEDWFGEAAEIAVDGLLALAGAGSVREIDVCRRRSVSGGAVVRLSEPVPIGREVEMSPDRIGIRAHRRQIE
jgi:hypothetical protein